MNEGTSIPANEINIATDVCPDLGQPSKNETTWKVYGLCDPRKPRKVRYVGVTGYLGVRLSKHVSRPGSRDLRQWIKELRAEGLTPCVIVLAQYRERDHALAREKELIQADRTLLNIQHSPNYKPEPEVMADVKTLQEVETEHIRKALSLCYGNKLLAAKLLGIGRQTLYNKVAALGIPH